MAIRVRAVPSAVVVAVLWGTTPLLHSTEPIVVLLEGQRRELVPVSRGDAEMLALDQVISGLGIGLASDAKAGVVTLRYQGREVALYHRKSLASVGGELRLMSSPVLFDGGVWLVPVDSIPRLLGPLLQKPAVYRQGQRVLVLGNVGIPKIGVATYVGGDVVRVVLEASEKVPFRVLQEEGRVTVSVQRELVDVVFQQERLTGGIVDWVQFLGGRQNLFAVTLGRRFQQLKASEQESPARLVLEFLAPPLQARPPASPAPAVSSFPRPADTPAPVVIPAGVRTVVIDPGHGGGEVGARGPGGTLEKDVTLAIARKLRGVLANSQGLQVFLTRDKDEELALDERAAIANNYKADVFISIHANASRSHGASGSEVYFLSYQASDDESRRVALQEGGALPLPQSSVPGSDVSLILWDMAQAEHLEESSALASRIQEELTQVTGAGQGRGIKQAPFRVLVGASMPAVLVEVAFISHPEEEKLLNSDPFQNRVVSALAKGVARYQAERQRRTGLPALPQRPGS